MTLLRPRKRFRLAASAAMLPILALALMASSCVNLRQAPTEKNYFVIDVERPGSATPPPLEGAKERILSVRNFRIAPNYEGKYLVYRKSEAGYESDFYNEYFTSTDKMFTEETRQWFAKSGLFAQVVDTSSRMEATHVLEGSVSKLHGDFTDPKAPKAVLEIQFLLMDDRGVNPKTLASKTINKEIPLDERSPEALVAGLAEALEQSLSEFESDLRDVLK